MPLISGIPSFITNDKLNNFKIVIENCSPFDIMIDRDTHHSSWKKKNLSHLQMTSFPQDAKKFRTDFQKGRRYFPD
jgi:hypothetical protein